MNCRDRAEYVSALCDGQTIPPAEAAHIDGCEECQALLREYLEVGAALRTAASVAFARESPPWRAPAGNTTLLHWWQKGTGTMRIPRLVFAALLAVIAVLTSGLAVIGVHAHSDGSVALLTVTLPDGTTAAVGVSTVDPKWAACDRLIQTKNGSVAFRFHALGKQGDHVLLALQVKTFPPGPAGLGPSTFAEVPERHYSFAPGETIPVSLPNLGETTIGMEWTDHTPFLAGSSDEQLDAAPDQMRVISPVLIRDKQVLGDMQGLSATADHGDAVKLYFPGAGLFGISHAHLPGAIPAQVDLNRISFTIDEQSYEVLMAAPVTRQDRVWILHNASYQPAERWAGHPFLAAGPDLNEFR